MRWIISKLIVIPFIIYAVFVKIVVAIMKILPNDYTGKFEYFIVIALPKLFYRVYYLGRIKKANGINPFITSNCEDIFRIKVDESLYSVYNRLFRIQGYSGNGYCWQGHVFQILRRENKELLAHIQFDPNADSFLMIVDTIENQEKTIDLLNSIFSNHSKLMGYIKSADWRKIDD